MTTLKLPFEQLDPLLVTPQLRELLAKGHIHRVRTEVGDPAWLVTHHPDVRQLLDDDRLGRSHPEPGTAARTSESALFGGPTGNFATEHADHTRMRALLQPHFTPRHMRDLRPRIEALTARLLDELAAQGSPADLHVMLAVPLPILVISNCSGCPMTTVTGFAPGRPPRPTLATTPGQRTGWPSCTRTAASLSPSNAASRPTM